MSNTKKKKIQAMAVQMIKNFQANMEAKIERALNSGALDIDSWEEDINPAILPKVIAIAVLEDTADGFKATGTCFEKEVKKEVANVKCFI